MSLSPEERDRPYLLMKEVALLIAEQYRATLDLPGTTSLRGVAANMVGLAATRFATRPERQADVAAFSAYNAYTSSADFHPELARDLVYSAFSQIVPIRDIKGRTRGETLEELQYELMNKQNSLRRLPEWLLLATLATHDPDPLKRMAIGLQLDGPASDKRESSA